MALFTLFQETTFNGYGLGVLSKAVNREDILSRRFRDRDLAKFESSRRYRER
jgi:hypothetical protein